MPKPNWNAIGRGLLAVLRPVAHFIDWLLNLRIVVYPVTAAAAAVAVVVAVTWVWKADPFKTVPLTPQEIVAQATKNYDQTRAYDLGEAIADDGEGSDELQTFVGHAYLNLSEAKDRISIQQLFNQKLVLSAPSEEGSKWGRYLSQAWVGSGENHSRAQKEGVRLLTDQNRQADWTKNPCLQYVQRVVRPAKFGTTQSAEQMEKDGLALLYENKGEKTKYYGPAGSRKCEKFVK